MFKAMIIKEITIVLRDKHALAMLFLMPALFILIMSLALRDAFNTKQALVKCAIINNSSSFLADDFIDYIYDESILKIVNTPTTDTAEILKNYAQIIITINKDFDPDMYIEAKDIKNINILANPDLDQSRILALTAVITKAIQKTNADEKDLKDLDKGISIKYFNTKANKRPSSVQQTVPSWIIFGIFFIVAPMSTIFLAERNQNTLVRLSSMNVSIFAFLIGKIIPYMLINQIQIVLMLIVGMYIAPLCGADALTIGNSPIGIILISLAISIAAIGTALCISLYTNSVSQATTVGGVFNIFLGAIGGIMVPTFIMPPFMQELSNISPMAWGLQGYLDIFLRGYNWQEVIPEASKLFLFGLIAIILAAIKLRKDLRSMA